ncbi:MAG: HAD family hydrolase [Candidatus Bathyarchaeia archaeon]
MIKVVSMDLEGTLVTLHFSDMVWNVGIPKLYAEQRELTFEDAKRVVFEEYQKIGDERREWYDINFWFKNLNLKGDWKGLMEAYRGELEVYHEVPEVLKTLSGRYRLILLSNSSREFIEFELKALGKGFERVFSATSDFNTVKKSAQVYRMVCEILGVRPSEIVHVGDHYESDFLTPRTVGIKSFYLDRSGRTSGEWVVKDLNEFLERVDRMSSSS